MTTTRSTVFQLLASIALCIVVIPLAGWGRDGHAIIAQLAYAELTPTARERVDRILRGDALPEVAAWPDQVRREPDYWWTGPLHYANPSPEHEEYDHARDCPPQGNVVTGVVDFARVLADESASEADRREALLFVVHFVGDLHQPLHAGNAADRGGNDITVSFFERERNIHSIWDSGIMRAHDDRAWPFWVARLLPEITDGDREAWIADLNAVDTQTVGQWVGESRRLATQHCYVLEPGDVVGEAYVADKMPVVDVRLKQGGVRLGAVLNKLLDPSSGE